LLFVMNSIGLGRICNFALYSHLSQTERKKIQMFIVRSSNFIIRIWWIFAYFVHIFSVCGCGWHKALASKSTVGF